MTAARNWYVWHADYDELTSMAGHRLGLVQDRIRQFLDSAASGPLQVLSMAAGQARELIPLVISHPRGRDVRARLVELDAANADLAEGAVLSAQLTDIEVLVADAGLADSYAGAVPADLILVCGLFGMLDRADTETTIAELDRLCAPGATVIWADEDRSELAGLFQAAGFTVDAGADGCGTARLHRVPRGFRSGRLFHAS